MYNQIIKIVLEVAFNMDKVVEIICRQNPEMKLKCNKCSAEGKVKSKDVFKQKVYKFECKKCGEITTYDTSKFADDFKKQMKKLGITIG